VGVVGISVAREVRRSLAMLSGEAHADHDQAGAVMLARRPSASTWLVVRP
jgi:hypothetical protein